MKSRMNHLNVALCGFFLWLLQSENSEMTIVAFLIFPTQTSNFNVESLRGQAISKQLKDTVDAVQRDIGHRLFEVCLRSDPWKVFHYYFHS